MKSHLISWCWRWKQTSCFFALSFLHTTFWVLKGNTIFFHYSFTHLCKHNLAHCWDCCCCCYCLIRDDTDKKAEGKETSWLNLFMFQLAKVLSTLLVRPPFPLISKPAQYCEYFMYSNAYICVVCTTGCIWKLVNTLHNSRIVKAPVRE